MSVKRATVFLGSLGFFALLAWLGGYDFNERNWGVAYYTLVAFLCSLFIASFPWRDF